MKHWLILGLAGLVILIVAWLGLRHWYSQNLLAPAPGSTKAILFRIEPGTSSFAISKNLEKSGLVRDRFALNLYLFSHDLASHMQAGLYRLSPNLTAGQVANIISSGQTAALTVTVTPGERLDQIKITLNSVGYKQADVDTALAASYPYSILKDKPAGATLEGYLFPDTYRIEVDKPVGTLIDLMLLNTDQKITTAIRNGWAAQGLNLHQGLSLTSIVEKETNRYSDQTQVAQVYLKRLNIGMRLESNPTFIYAAAILGVEPSTTIDSPYNTYIYHGLPPTPIGAVTLSAALSVAKPADTDWLYFLADKDGNTHFASTLEEHKQNIEKYLQ